MEIDTQDKQFYACLSICCSASVCVHSYMLEYICESTYIHVYTDIYIYIRELVLTSIHVCRNICVYVYMYMYTDIYIYVSEFVLVYILICIYKYLCVYICMYIQI